MHEEVFGYEPVKYDWMETVYGCEPMEEDDRAPPPKGKSVRCSSFVDANLMHDLVTGRSASGILEFLNRTPIDWFSKRQGQVESATYGSEFMVARQGTERLQDLIYTLKSFGVPVEDVAWMFGDNQSVVTSSTLPHSTLGKRWNALSYHKVREAIASGWLRFEHISGKENPADIMTKPLAWHEMKSHVEMFLFWKGDTAAMPNETNEPSRDPNTEGSVTGPGLDTRDSGNATGMTHALRAVHNANSRNTIEIPTVIPNRDVLWNNQYGPLYDSDQDIIRSSDVTRND
jgi:hypothetical protein